MRKKYKIFGFLFIVAFAFVGHSAHAYVLGPSQYDNSTVIASTPTSGTWEFKTACIATPYISPTVVNTASLYVSATSGYTGSAQLLIEGFSASTCASGTAVSGTSMVYSPEDSSPAWVTGSPTVVDWSNTTGLNYDFSNAPYHAFQVAFPGQAGKVISIYGTSGNSGYTTSGCITGIGGGGCVVTGSMAYVFDTQVGVPSTFVNNLNRVSLLSPIAFSTATSTTVSLSGQYYYNNSVSFSLGSYQGVQLTLQQGLGPYSPVVLLLPSTTTANALTSWSSSQVLPANSTWTATACLLYGSTCLYSSSSVTFYVITSGSITTTAGGLVDVTGHCSTYTFGMNYLCDIVVWVFYPDPSAVAQFQTLSFRNSIPFCYFYDMQNLYVSLISDSGGAGNTLTVTIPWDATHNLTLLSAGLVSAVPFASTIKDLLTYLMYAMVALFIYRIIMNETHKK